MKEKFFIGIDIGGTFIKGGIVNSFGNIICHDQLPTDREKDQEGSIEIICDLIDILLEKSNLKIKAISGIGVGCPGMIDSVNGQVVFWGNLNWVRFNIVEKLSKRLNLPVKLANDANVAALGEAKYGAGKNYKDSICITLGTGVGGGIIIDGKLFEGNLGAGAEIGHMVIVKDGDQCTCGRKGCFERYASASYLIRETCKEMKVHKDCKMWGIGSIKKVNSKTPFDFCKIDKYAKKIIDNYLHYLACGITNLVNIFRPEAIILGGGVSKQGDNLIKPLNKIICGEIFGKESGPRVDILCAKLGNSAGLIGAAELIKNSLKK